MLVGRFLAHGLPDGQVTRFVDSVAGRGATSMKVTLILADYAQVSEGKLYLLGGGWVLKGHGVPMALGIIVEVPWDETDRPHPWTLRLVDADGHPAMIPGPAGDTQTLGIAGQVEVSRPSSYPPGTPFNVSLAINLGLIALPPARRFTFVMEVDGLPIENGQASFSTMPAAPPPGPPGL